FFLYRLSLFFLIFLGRQDREQLELQHLIPTFRSQVLEVRALVFRFKSYPFVSTFVFSFQDYAMPNALEWVGDGNLLFISLSSLLYNLGLGCLVFFNKVASSIVC